jgi:hypothetical protein
MRISQQGRKRVHLLKPTRSRSLDALFLTRSTSASFRVIRLRRSLPQMATSMPPLGLAERERVLGWWAAESNLAGWLSESLSDEALVLLDPEEERRIIRPIIQAKGMQEEPKTCVASLSLIFLVT